MSNAAGFQPNKKKKRKATINSSKELSDEDEQNFQVTNVDEFLSDDERHSWRNDTSIQEK